MIIPMASRRRAWCQGCLAVAWATLMPAAVAAEPGFALHAEGFAARIVGQPKADQFGWGAGGWVSPELRLGERLGIELPIGVVGLTNGSGAETALGLAETGAGYAAFAIPSLRVRPFGGRTPSGIFAAAGLWVSGGGGVAYTGNVIRPVLGARLGYDLFVSPRFRVGPSAGFVQIIENSSEVSPEDARLVLIGVHLAMEKPVEQVVSDRDRDGIPDHRDTCPDTPEDRDGFEDEDGCPDIDNDQDGVLDKVDSCPDEPEDLDGHDDLDGCPDIDNDDDGLLDTKDNCPDIAEDPDGFEDEDGCPDLDNDQDGFPDNVDKCPNEPETVNNYADDDGCPDEKLVRVRGDEILLDDRVYFRINMDQIQVRSWPLLKTVAKLLKANRQYERVRIQGHADKRGDPTFNQQLSLRRGQAVRKMLTEFGVAAERLVVEGFGDSRPMRAGATEYAWRKNRRVDFRIIQRAKFVAQDSVPSGEKKKPPTAKEKTAPGGEDATSDPSEDDATSADRTKTEEAYGE